MSKKPHLILKGTRITIDGNEWTIILMPLKAGAFPPKTSENLPVDGEQFWRAACQLSLAVTTEQVDGQYSFSVPQSLAIPMRSKIGRDFQWESIQIPLVS